MSGWNDFLKSYFNSDKKTENEKNPRANNMQQFEELYYNSGKKKEEEKPETPSHVVIDEQVEKYVEEHIVEEPEQLIETEVDAYEAAIVDGGYPIELDETKETHLVDGPTPRPEEEPDFTAEELEEFKRLNKIEDLHENNEPKPVELEPNEVIVTEQPTETKVKKVKVSKPKTTKAPKSPRGPKSKK